MVLLFLILNVLSVFVIIVALIIRNKDSTLNSEEYKMPFLFSYYNGKKYHKVRINYIKLNKKVPLVLDELIESFHPLYVKIECSLLSKNEKKDFYLENLHTFMLIERDLLDIVEKIINGDKSTTTILANKLLQSMEENGYLHNIILNLLDEYSKFCEKLELKKKDEETALIELTKKRYENYIPFRELNNNISTLMKKYDKNKKSYD